MEDLIVEARMGENGGEYREVDDEFYETIDAPKYVDFLGPSPPLLDSNPSWFCSRVGKCLFLYLLCYPVFVST